MKSLRRIAAAMVSLLLALGGCAAPLVSRTALPEHCSLIRGPLVIHSDFVLPADDRLWDELAARQSELGRRLGLPASDEPVYIYLFPDAAQFREFIRARHPEFPDRRAFFVDSDAHPAVYAQWGQRLADDLRHELTHAYLHAVVPGLPLWLDEGLAKYAEIPPAGQGLNRPYLRQIAAAVEKGGWHPNLRRLEQLSPAADLGQEDYVESWAWVHFLLESEPARADLLRQYLADLRGGGPVEPLSSRLTRQVGWPEWALLEHVRVLATAGDCPNFRGNENGTVPFDARDRPGGAPKNSPGPSGGSVATGL
jgi:hypothetical protein